LIDEYKAFTGHDALEDFPEWEPAHKTLMVKGGIPGIENAGGNLDGVSGKRCTFMCFPWRWPGGDGCIVRLLALVDEDGTFRFETGK
jgi:kynurenine formamidase